MKSVVPRNATLPPEAQIAIVVPVVSEAMPFQRVVAEVSKMVAVPTAGRLASAATGKLIVTLFVAVPEPVTLNENHAVTMRPTRMYKLCTFVVVTAPDCTTDGDHEIRPPCTGPIVDHAEPV